MRTLALTGAALTVFALAACGGTDDQADPAADAAPETGQSAAAQWSEQQIVDHLGLTPTTPEGSYMYGETCQVPVVMTSQQAVDMYAEAGDTVATTPDGTAGVKVVGDCGAELDAQLDTLG